MGFPTLLPGQVLFIIIMFKAIMPLKLLNVRKYWKCHIKIVLRRFMITLKYFPDRNRQEKISFNDYYGHMGQSVLYLRQEIL